MGGNGLALAGDTRSVLGGTNWYLVTEVDIV